MQRTGDGAASPSLRAHDSHACRCVKGLAALARRLLVSPPS
jgi:hypothetical protein